MGSAGSSATGVNDCGYIVEVSTSDVGTDVLEGISGGDVGDTEETTVFEVISVCIVFLSLFVGDAMNDDDAGNGRLIPPSACNVGDVTMAPMESVNGDWKRFSTAEASLSTGEIGVGSCPSTMMDVSKLGLGGFSLSFCACVSIVRFVVDACESVMMNVVVKMGFILCLSLDSDDDDAAAYGHVVDLQCFVFSRRMLDDLPACSLCFA